VKGEEKTKDKRKKTKVLKVLAEGSACQGTSEAQGKKHEWNFLTVTFKPDPFTLLEIRFFLF